MVYLWTEDTGAGLHFWKLVNEYCFENKLVIESKGSNQGLLDAVKGLTPKEGEVYLLAFDIVYDNQDIVNKLLDLQQEIAKNPAQIKLLDLTCFEEIIFKFSKLIEWTGTGRKDKIQFREHILDALSNHKIDITKISDEKTMNYLMNFKRFTTERVLKSITYELTDGDEWSVKGDEMGKCWYKDCCVLEKPEKACCNVKDMLGQEKIKEVFEEGMLWKIKLKDSLLS